LSSFFGLLALMLASIGLYGLMSYTVARRTHEIGIRMALGARAGNVLWMVMREILALVLIGVAVGLPAALLSTQFISSMLFGLTPNDPLTIREEGFTSRSDGRIAIRIAVPPRAHLDSSHP
jgi:ABC-type antimicrobial peptide transport system permease subunit